MTNIKTWPDRLTAVRKYLRWGQDEMGRYLGRGREWVSRLENGKGEFSEIVILKIEMLERVQKQHNFVTLDEALRLTGPGLSDDAGDKLLREGQRPYKGAESNRQRLLRQFTELLDAAGDDPDRLGWIAEQMRRHLDEPAHWGMARRVLEEILQEEQEAKQVKQSQSQGAGGQSQRQVS